MKHICLLITTSIFLTNLSVSYAQSIQEQVRESYDNVPIGTIMAYAGSVEVFNQHLNGDFLICNGDTVNRQDYPKLFYVIGTNWGGTGTLTFIIPDLRGKFLRGMDMGSGYDPDVNQRTNINGSATLGDQVGSYQPDATRVPNSTFSVAVHQSGQGNFPGSNRHSGYYDTAPYGHNKSITVSGGDRETRPKNASVIFIIRAK